MTVGNEDDEHLGVVNSCQAFRKRRIGTRRPVTAVERQPAKPLESPPALSPDNPFRSSSVEEMKTLGACAFAIRV